MFLKCFSLSARFQPDVSYRHISYRSTVNLRQANVTITRTMFSVGHGALHSEVWSGVELVGAVGGTTSPKVYL